MGKLEFYKGHCNGSDTIVVVNETRQMLTDARIAELCDRNRGIGAQTLVIVSPVAHDARAVELRELDPDLKWVAQVYDDSGQPTAQNSTALRLAAHALVAGHGENVARRDTLPFATPQGITDVLIGVATTSIDLGRWKLGEERLVLSAGERVQRPGLGITIDTDYTVVAVASQDELETLYLSQAVSIEPSVAGEQLIVYVTPSDTVIKDSVGQITARTHSSIYGEVHAAGGALAAGALAFRHWGGAEMPHRWRVTTPDGSAAVRMYPTQEGEHVSTAAPVTLSFRGETIE